VPANNIAELLAYIRANPGKLNYGSGNSTSIVATAQLAQQEKLDVVHIPYKGDGPLSVDLLGGRVQFAIATPGTAAPQVKEGKLKVLATLLPSRSPLLPEAPTFAEAGLRPLSITPWGAVYGPAHMPKEIVSRVGLELGVVLKRPDVREAFQKLAFEPRSSTPEELAAFVKEQGEVWRRVVDGSRDQARVSAPSRFDAGSRPEGSQPGDLALGELARGGDPLLAQRLLVDLAFQERPGLPVADRAHARHVGVQLEYLFLAPDFVDRPARSMCRSAARSCGAAPLARAPARSP
jgi:hypothetical protein